MLIDAPAINSALAVTSVCLFGTTMFSTGMAMARWGMGESIKIVPVINERQIQLRAEVGKLTESLDSLSNELARAGVFNRRHGDEE